MQFNSTRFLKPYPFIRLFFSFVLGIITEWYLQFNILFAVIILFGLILLTISFRFLKTSKQYSLRWLRGLFILLMFVCLGIVFTWQQNIQHNSNWFGNYYKPNTDLLLTINEPLVEKPNSYKAEASVEAIYQNKKWIAVKGNILIYFKKEKNKPTLQYGSQIILHKALQTISNSGNPAAFNYKRYCLFQGITHQVFLSSNDYITLSTQQKNNFTAFLFATHIHVISTIQKYVSSAKEAGIAEALLIGYRNDLDKELMQAYSNTGVVHIIAISGLHIGIIYTLLLSIFSLIKPSKFKRWFQPVFILIIIWLFTLLAGAAPSVLRAAVMFSFISFGKFIDKNGNVYNTLTASAFILLCINPFYLWDAGFQLSYAAVAGIMMFYKPVYTFIYVENKILQWLWKLCAVSISAQVFTLPIVIFHFHQLPLLFIISNVIAVPLSGIILYAELILIAFSWFNSVAIFSGLVIQYLIKTMNGSIEMINHIPFSVWSGMQISIWQTLLLYGFIICIIVWLFTKNRFNIITALSFAIAFFVLRDINLINHSHQQKIIVYNIPQHHAIDIINGNNFLFTGDTSVITNTSNFIYTLKPSHVKLRLSSKKFSVINIKQNVILNCNDKKIAFINGSLTPVINSNQKIKVDAVIVNNQAVSAFDINKIFDCRQIVIDSSIPFYKIEQWKKDCDSLHLRCFATVTDGAFIFNT